MTEADVGDQHDVTIPGAVATRPLLVAAIALAGLLAGLWFGSRGAETYSATATIVVQDPRTTEANAIVLSAERYVAEQVAIFELDTIASAAADIATAEHQTTLRQRSPAQVAVGDTDPVVIGIDGSISVSDDVGELTKSADGALGTSAPGTPVVSDTATVLQADGSPVLDAQGRQVFVGASDAVIMRSDGVIVVARTDRPPIVVTAGGVVIESFASADLPTGVAPNLDGGVTIGAGSYSVEIARGLRPLVHDRDALPLAPPGRIAPLGVNERMILLGFNDRLAAESESDTVALVDDEFVVVDHDGMVTQQDEGVQFETVEQTSDEFLVEFDSRLIEDNRSVQGSADSSVIEVTYQAPSEELAVIGANALVAAYRERQNIDVSASTTGALDEADVTIAAALAELAEIEAELTVALTVDPNRDRLNDQYDEVIRELADAGEDLLATGDGDAVAAQRLRDLVSQLDAIERVRIVELLQDDAAEIVQRRDEMQERIAALRLQRDQIVINEPVVRENVVLESPATEADAVGGLGPGRLGLVGLVLGAILGAVVAYLLESSAPRTVESAEAAMRELGLPLIGEVPDFRHERLATRVPVIEAPRSFASEAINIAASTLAVGMTGEQGAVIGVVSADVGDGKTTIASNLAAAFARQQRRVLAIDADLEGQVLSLLFGFGPDPVDAGLWELVSGEQVDAKNVVKKVAASPTDSLDLLLPGASAQQLRSRFDSLDISGLFAGLRDQYDVILVDVPPLLNVAYATPLLRLLDGVVIVTRPGAPTQALVQVRERVDFVGVPPLGFIFNRGPLRPDRTASIAAQHYASTRGFLRWRGRRSDDAIPEREPPTDEDV